MISPGICDAYAAMDVFRKSFSDDVSFGSSMGDDVPDDLLPNLFIWSGLRLDPIIGGQVDIVRNETLKVCDGGLATWSVSADAKNGYSDLRL